jgi:hypothetical protein
VNWKTLKALKAEDYLLVEMRAAFLFRKILKPNAAVLPSLAEVPS